MNIKIGAVGKIKKAYIKEGVCDYSRRLSKYINIEIIEVKDEKCGDDVSNAGESLIKKREGERLLSTIKGSCFVVCLDVKGEQLSTEQLAEFINAKAMNRTKELFFIIGGHLGLCESVLSRADFKLSLSKMTLPHEMARLLLLEQLYRAEKILNGEPYHK